jgi:dUTP pyrophosphatase
MNSPGTIDSGYRGEMGVILHNASGATFEFDRGDRIAQMVLQRYTHASLIEVEDLPDTLRGEMGLGSTGL